MTTEKKCSKFINTRLKITYKLESKVRTRSSWNYQIYINFKYGIFIIIYEPDNLFLLLLDVKTTELPLARGKKVLLKKLQSRSKKWKNDDRLPQA